MTAALALVEVPVDPFATVRAWRRMVSAGFSLSVEGDRLVVIPASGLSERQRAYLRIHKAALVGLLTDAKTLSDALVLYGLAGLGWRQGTPDEWSDARLLAAGEVLYSTRGMVSRNGRRYCSGSAPAIEEAPEYHPPAESSEIEANAVTTNVLPMDREAFEERAAIMEFDGGLPRAEAKRKALALATQVRATP